MRALKAYQQQAWAAGDYAMVGRTAVIASELLCEAVDLRAGQKVLDVATGSGNTALAAARRWCEVVGIDYVPELLATARQRASFERLEVTFSEGDAEAIPFPEASFDVVLSTFGSMFAPDQQKAADELLRVCRPGGRIGLTNWTPDSLVGEFFRSVVKRLPLPTGVQPPVLWGTEDRLRGLFGGGISSLQVTRRNLVHRYRSANHYVEYFRTYFGPAVKAFERLDPLEQDRLNQEMVDSLERHNQSGDETLVVPSDYLEVVAIRS
jgi:SAM-dependent methyltransferase